MMYLPQHFRLKNVERAIKLIQNNPLATVITASGGVPEITMTPVLINQERSQLEGHFALQNDIWRNLQEPNTTTFLFQGPHGYISHAWYLTSPHLPTWNYAVIEVKAEVVLVNSQESTLKLLDKLTKYFDGNFSEFITSNSYLELINEAAAGVIGFKAKISSINAKFKLSQNKRSSDVGKLITALRIRKTNTDNLLADLMEQELNDQLKK